MSPHQNIPDTRVQKAFQDFPDNVRAKLHELRALILRTAAELPEIGPLQETLKWGQPAYLTPETGAATTIRLGIPKAGGYALYTHCQTSVISEFQLLFPDELKFEGNRAVLFAAGEDLPEGPMIALITRALTYHLRKR
ncbi:DUF1801 domain-containing protein [Aliiroseovarius sp. F20344]|uniref:DUF1801 domain-containing protein n=1 Tax=Aliiroseovarius sp. F20344 TaxID=2926414 RepID=UPI001FF42D44|nr:DUF1801 domain-containing protein [Aliiroseovarius sp. F20344]MCK0143991.1 DUF1801 domain-containing protein [Aliiroseovarius sp. F20344]